MINTLLLLLVTLNLVDGKSNAGLVRFVNHTELHQADTIQIVNPPLNGFYSKYLDADGIAIRSANVVDDKALYVASSKIRKMLYYMTATKENLVKNGAEFHIIGKDQQTSDLPEFADRKGVNYMDNGILTDIDKRTRGMGGLYASCGEENLLNLPNDRYSGGFDICAHEFAHSIMAFGFDEKLRSLISLQHQRAVSKGLWKGSYAASNPYEYWAELSSWYFGGHGEFLPGTNLPEQGAAGLRAYDYDGYSLLASIYSGILGPELLERQPATIVSSAERSIQSAEKAVLTIINNRSVKLKLYWFDFEGKQHLYGDVTAYGRITQPTFISHVWKIEDDYGTRLATVKVDRQAFEVVFKYD